MDAMYKIAMYKDARVSNDHNDENDTCKVKYTIYYQHS